MDIIALNIVEKECHREREKSGANLAGEREKVSAAQWDKREKYIRIDQRRSRRRRAHWALQDNTALVVSRYWPTETRERKAMENQMCQCDSKRRRLQVKGNKQRLAETQTRAQPGLAEWPHLLFGWFDLPVQSEMACQFVCVIFGN